MIFTQPNENAPCLGPVFGLAPSRREMPAPGVKREPLLGATMSPHCSRSHYTTCKWKTPRSMSPEQISNHRQSQRQ